MRCRKIFPDLSRAKLSTYPEKHYRIRARPNATLEVNG